MNVLRQLSVIALSLLIAGCATSASPMARTRADRRVSKWPKRAGIRDWETELRGGSPSVRNCSHPARGVIVRATSPCFRGQLGKVLGKVKAVTAVTAS